jgi:uncharacterized membrane protein
MTFLQLAIPIHIAAAAIALATVAIPLVTKKGAAMHRRVGRVYVWAMAVATTSGMAISAWRLALDPDPRRQPRSLFLFYASLLAATAVRFGARVLKTKTRTTPHRNPFDLALPFMLAAGGAALMVYGARRGATLLVAFPPIGLLLGVGQLVHWLTRPRTRFDWWLQHMAGMIASAIAALTAFMVVNAPNLHLPSFSLWIWLGPTAIGVPGLLLWQAYYRRRFAPSAAASADR